MPHRMEPSDDVVDDHATERTVGSSALAREGTLALVLISPWVLLALLAVVFVVAIWLTIGCSICRSLRENGRERAAPECRAATSADLKSGAYRQ